MREIVFRGQDHTKKWHYGTPLVFSENFVCMTSANTHNTSVIPATVGQCTGLTDKNGKKIFEGDILKFKEPFRGADSTIFVVEWDDVNARFLGFTVGGIGRYMVYVGREPKCEIIGNIHDNPELLN